ncbi:PhoX family protein [Pyxidicoccus caerfyrddinensis]|uniref:PhoX family protein n=1 Tax=Pyxidicoccus caerfyrddinensis TaxID=2709663 RepID=UPI0013D9C812|nr:alkaline phosphatase PhoX [Pyxidicoccus caerfyrddinensis]
MSSRLMGLATSAMLLGSTVAVVGCEGEQGLAGTQGPAGQDGQDGAPGRDGTNGTPGQDGDDGAPGQDGDDGSPGQDGDDGQPGSQGPAGPGSYGQPGPGAITRSPGVEAGTPLSSVIAITFRGDLGTGAGNLPEYVKARVNQVVAGQMPTPMVFPLPPASTDTVRTVPGLFSSTVIKWMDPIGYSKTSPRFGANVDYIAFFGDKWSANGNAPQYNGSGSAAWMWINHEYISGTKPSTGKAPLGQHLDFAKFLRNTAVLPNTVTDGTTWQANELVTYNKEWKKQLGGSWIRVVQDPATGEWAVDRSAANLRYDASSATLAKVVGVTLSGTERDDSGAVLPDGVVPGTHSNCSGGQTPWGTIFTGEENVQGVYGDPELALWVDGRNEWTANAQGFAPGAPVAPDFSAPVSGDLVSSDVNSTHRKDGYAYLTEIDPGQPGDLWYDKDAAKPGEGHRKLGIMGRAHWENAAFVVDANWKLLNNQPIVIYGGDDRRGGRIFKFVSSGNYTAGMTKKQVRDLLNDGKLYAAHFAGLDNSTGDTLMGGVIPTEQAPGQGRWVELSVDSQDLAPNGEAYGQPTLTVGAALRDANYNAVGGFTTDDQVRKVLFTVANKLGVMELNRPEDLEWNPKDPSGQPLLYVAFTEHGQPTYLDQQGRVATAWFNGTSWVTKTRGATDNRSGDRVGSIFGIRESSTSAPGGSKTFTYFRVWKGETASLSAAPEYSAAKPDNILIDRDGGVWFGTDGNFGVNKVADSVYYLNQNPAHVGSEYFRRAFRVLSLPSDAEATGPAFSSDMKTLFVSVQHPGEDNFSVWP